MMKVARWNSVYPQEHFAYHKRPFWPVLCLKRIGLPCCILVTFIVTCPLEITLLSNYSATYNFSTCRHYLAENHLPFPSAPRWVWHSYLSKRLQLTPYTCGSSRLFYGTFAEEWSAFGMWTLVRKHYYYVLKFIVTCYYGKQSFEGFVRGIFTSTRTKISCPSTYCTYWNIGYEIPSGMIEQLLANPYAGDGTEHPDMHLIYVDEICGLFKLAGFPGDDSEEGFPFIFEGKLIVVPVKAKIRRTNPSKDCFP